MNTEFTVEQLLRWRLARAAANAPRAPRAAQLLAMTRPWWETWPEKFQSLVDRVGTIQIAYGHAMAEPGNARTGHLVAALVVRAGEELETSARILYFNIRDGRLRLRFQLDATVGQAPESFEVAFITEKSAAPLVSTEAILSVDSEYRVDAEISDELARSWELLKVTDRMPFRLILRTEI